ncbi:MAG: murein biosynthesis integral membrane protein MurJ [Nitrospiraceae bacterium]
MSDPAPAVAPSPSKDDNHSVVKAAGLIGLATFSSRILGFVRDMVLARLFGATAAADAFFVAYRIPNLLRELFAEGSMSAAFIPVFTEYHTLRSKQDAWELASAAFTTLLTIVTAITLAGILAAPWIAWLIGWGFHDDPAKLELTTVLTRVMFPYLLFISLAALAMGVLNSMRAFAAPAFSPVFFNIVIIGCAFLLAPQMEQPILGVAIGVVVGGAAQFAMQLPGLHARGMLFGLLFQPQHPGVKRIGLLMVPSLLGLSVTQINILVSTFLGSLFPGGPTYLFYGMRLIQFPLGIFGVALATAILPTLTAQAARGALDDLRTTLGFGLRMILFIILPAMLGLILLRVPIVHLFFEHGSFTAADTAATATAVLCYAVGLWAFAGVRIIVSAYYSLQDTKTPRHHHGAGRWGQHHLLGHFDETISAQGLALTALASMLNGSILVAVLNRRLGRVDWGSVARSAGRVLIACLPLVLICLAVAQAPIWKEPGAWIMKTVWLAGGIGCSVVGYVVAHLWLGSEELDVALGLVKRKLGRVAKKFGGV